MAITTTTISKSVGWARTDVIIQLEEAFSWLGWHGSARSGLVTSVTVQSGGGTISNLGGIYYEDVSPSSTSGIGSGASFNVYRAGGTINAIWVNRPGYGYTNGEVSTLPASAIGGVANGATNLVVSVGTTSTSFGSSTTYYDKNVTSGGSYPWGVVRHQIQANKRYGDTYRAFQVNSDNQLSIFAGSGFQPFDVQNTSQQTTAAGVGYPNRFAGTSNNNGTNPITDITWNTSTNAFWFDINNDRMSGNQIYQFQNETIASSNSYGLSLKIYRSGIDPNFAVFSYTQPTLSSTKLRDNTFLTFFVHNFTSTLWDYDSVFLGGATKIVPSPSDSGGVAYLDFITECSGLQQLGQYQGTSRTAEYGYLQLESNYYSEIYKKTRYFSPTSDSSSGSVQDNPSLYYRDAARGGSYNAVIKGIPINMNLIPVPYYIPDDFVLIQFDYSAPSANIQQGDTVTISGSEIYTVITGSYRQDGATRGILFCARTT